MFKKIDLRKSLFCGNVRTVYYVQKWYPTNLSKSAHFQQGTPPLNGSHFLEIDTKVDVVKLVSIFLLS